MSTENWAGAAIRDERYNYLYADEASRGWVTPLIDLSKNVKEEYVYFNNHFQGAAAKNAQTLEGFLKSYVKGSGIERR